MKNRVSIIGTGEIPNPGTTHPSQDFKELLTNSVYSAIRDANISPNDIDGVSYCYAGESEIGHGGISPTLNDALGLSLIPGFINCANCASGHAAFMQGCDMIQSGRYKNVLVAGFEKATDIIPFFDYALVSSDSLYDYNLGFSHIDTVLLQNEYFQQYHITPDKREAGLLAYAKFARKMGSKNPIAHFYGKKVPTDDELKKMPLFGSFMKTGEGSAALILTTEDNANKNYDHPVFVQGRSYVTTSHYVGHLYDSTLLRGVTDPTMGGLSKGIPLKIACQRAYKDAEIQPKDIDTIGVYDQVTSEFVSLEASGICPSGEAVDFVLSGEGNIDGQVPINTDGGNIGRGFAGGTAGLYPLIEIISQLNGTAKGYRIEHPIKYGMSTFIGGGFAHNASVILSNE